MSYFITVKGRQQPPHLGEEGLEIAAFHLVQALNLPDDELGVKENLNAPAVQLRCLRESEYQGLVFGDIVGAGAEISALGDYFLALSVKNHDARPGISGIAP
ncbi:MAG: hypothetical protein M0P70_12565 [Desulfobulbaceae bacterium]|nr:hypothetical protein [Desulfobulbaceae bacterium]